jgi:hypothetical protein
MTFSNNIQNDLQEILDNVDLIDGRLRKRDVQHDSQVQTVEGADIALYNTDFVYRECYIARITANIQHTLVRLHKTPQFCQNLSDVAGLHVECDWGWRVYGNAPAGMVSIMRGTQQQIVAKDLLITSLPTSFQNGTVGLLTRKDSCYWDDAFIHFSWGVDAVTPFSREVRLYFNLTPEVMPFFINRIGQVANRLKVPIRLKCLSEPALFTMRRDNTVCYLPLHLLTYLEAALGNAVKEVRDALINEVPLFTKKLIPGVGYAESPLSGASFGFDRSLILAKALEECLSSAKGPRQLYRPLVECLLKSGLDHRRPHRNPGSKYNIGFKTFIREAEG